MDLLSSDESPFSLPYPSQQSPDVHVVMENLSFPILSHQRMPPELWLSVFKSNCLPSEDLRSISLTQHIFRALAQPLIFRRFQISTSSKWFDDGCNPRSYQTPEYIERFRHRLSFVASDRIAPAVEDISVIGNYVAGRIPHLIDGAPLFDLLLGSIHCFHNLSELSGNSMIFTAPMIKALYALPRLHDLDLIWCSLESSAIPFNDNPRSRLFKFKHLEDYSNTETTVRIDYRR
ncbi:hypothetical protein NLI96_g12163 [Meripilus lineatus]|uniref:F-box domain-containing protein n=1 Tax=Meripilus lineatus TaxID=2056292 RepID=A0AAD5UQK9_9APHY|nr:hypothetical protein NLI96_g12163 [Physisporinus lineatus]